MIGRNLVYVSSSYVTSEEKLLQKGDILISTANSKALVGKVSIVKEMQTESTFGGFISSIRSSEFVLPEFLYYYLNSSFSQKRLSDISYQTTNIANIPNKELERFPIPLPTIPEQKAIIEILQRAERLKELRQEVDKKAEKLKNFCF